MADFDTMDYMEEEYGNYEDKYADELDELANFEEPEEIDFNTVLKSKNVKIQEDKKLKIDSNDTSQSVTAKGDISPKHSSGFGKRSCSEIDIDFFKENVENVFPHSGRLKPKKLKLDKADLDISLDHVSSNTNIKKVIEQLQSAPSEDDSFDEVAYNLSRQRVFSRPVFGMDTLNVTNTDGDRVFLKLYSEDELPSIEDKRWQSNSSESGLNLLSVPFDQLKREVQERRHAHMVKQAALSEGTETLQARNGSINENEPKEVKSTDLWVEKYMPRTYTDLLSDDGTNRFVLKWLKLWDEVVFGAESVKPKEKVTGDELDQGAIFTKKDGKTNFQNFKKFYNPEDDLVKDSKGRPKKKVALLCGNPGLGKTTLAHVISHHAGYNVVEMNASDDRSPEVFLNKIETSTQMKAVIGQTKRPNCLVIDEIDGAPVQAINILLDLIKTTDSGGVKGGKGKKKRKKKEFYLNRPIICICNDQFVPALRQLRQAAFTLKFPATIPSRLAGRLLIISQKENLRIDMGTLLMLADKAENDIRSCLNTLQFIKQKKNFKLDDLKNLDIGQKDIKKGFRSILTEVFQLPRKKKFIGQHTDTKSSATNRFHYMLHLVSGNSEFDKMMQGLFDEYLNCKTKDPYLESINLANEWLGFTDIVQRKISHDQDYVMWKFLSFLPVAFHMFFARASPGKIQYCNVSYENHLKKTHNLQTMQLMVNGMSPNLRRSCSSEIIILDLVPYIYFILIPSLRPVNTKLYSESEKQMFLSLINTLISYNLTYRQERTLEGQYTYVLEPNIEELVLYSGLPQHRQLLYATKQLIAREVELEKMRQAERIMKQGEVNEVSITSSGDKTPKPVVPEQSLKPRKIIKFADRPQVDFFGRVVQPNLKKAAKVENVEANKRIASVMNTATWFRFNEGYTNAVRRTIKLPEFL